MNGPLNLIRRFAGQIVAYIGFGLLLGYFSAAPNWSYFPTDKALVKLSYSHAGQRLKPCRTHTKAERAKLPPNAKPPKICPRERHPVKISLWLDDKLLLREVKPPTGFWGDSPSHFYRRFAVAPGRYELKLEMDDTGGTKALHRETTVIDLVDGGVRIIEAEHGNLRIR